ncbi:hypothetical protein [Salicibibacter halophilus]|uniref:hypothetical protein n=1 Tax=Salicibibacter halophilus TaxID=2502791 RepID=UPI001D04AE87|nr:hypothetical protein [Salicibibacter halophilus]
MKQTDTFERLIDALLASDAEVVEPSAGETHNIGSFLLELTHPGENFPATSIMIRFPSGCITEIYRSFLPVMPKGKLSSK